MLRLLLITALMLSGCTYSTNPIFTEKDNVFDEAFLGAWETEKDAMLFDMRKFEVTRWGPEEKSYRVVLRNETGGKQGTFQLFLSQIDRTKFLTWKHCAGHRTYKKYLSKFAHWERFRPLPSTKYLGLQNTGGLDGIVGRSRQ